MAAVAVLAKGIKSLISDVSGAVLIAIRERLTRSLGCDATAAEVAGLTAGMSIDTTCGAAQWLGLPGAVEAAPSSGPVTALARSTSPFGPAGVWELRDDATLTVRYRPAVHADPVLASWLELLTKTPHVESKPVAAAVLKELSKATVPGLCASCHSIEQGASGGADDQLERVRSLDEQRGSRSSRTSLTSCCRSSKTAQAAMRSMHRRVLPHRTRVSIRSSL